MHRLFFDINILLDVIQERKPHFQSAQRLLSQVAAGSLAGATPGFCSATTCVTLYYLVAKGTNHKTAIDVIRQILRTLSVVEINRKILERGLELDMKDYEDGVQVACAEFCKADYIITGNIKDFKNSPIRCLSASEYLALMSRA